jgi:hypothetical protein
MEIETNKILQRVRRKMAAGKSHTRIDDLEKYISDDFTDIKDIAKEAKKVLEAEHPELQFAITVGCGDWQYCQSHPKFAAWRVRRFSPDFNESFWYPKNLYK